MVRDNYLGEAPGKIDSYRDLVDFLNRLNADWVKATKRMSPSVLIELLEITGKDFNVYCKPRSFKACYLFRCVGGRRTITQLVSRCAGVHREMASSATNSWGRKQARYHDTRVYYPLIDTFMQALPHTYRNVQGRAGQTIEVFVTSDAGGKWYLTLGNDGWTLSKTRPASIDASVLIDPDTAWKLFTKAITAPEAETKINCKKATKKKPILSMLSVMAWVSETELLKM